MLNFNLSLHLLGTLCDALFRVSSAMYDKVSSCRIKVTVSAQPSKQQTARPGFPNIDHHSGDSSAPPPRANCVLTLGAPPGLSTFSSTLNVASSMAFQVFWSVFPLLTMRSRELVVTSESAGLGRNLFSVVDASNSPSAAQTNTTKFSESFSWTFDAVATASGMYRVACTPGTRWRFVDYSCLFLIILGWALLYTHTRHHFACL